MMPVGPDRDALLAALVLAPATFSRNRFFDLYRDPAMRRVRARASTLRGIVAQLAAPPSGGTATVRIEAADEASQSDEGPLTLVYELVPLGMRRTCLLDPLELSLVRYAVWRAAGGSSCLEPSEADRERIDAALRRLGPAGPRHPAAGRGFEGAQE